MDSRTPKVDGKTPLTDAELNNPLNHTFSMVSADFARTLELALAATEVKNEKLQKERDLFAKWQIWRDPDELLQRLEALEAAEARAREVEKLLPECRRVIDDLADAANLSYPDSILKRLDAAIALGEQGREKG